MILEDYQQELPEVEQTILTMTVSAELNTLDWKERYEQLQYDYKMEIERIRLHYDRELKEKVNEIRFQLKREYDEQFSIFRTQLLEQQEKMLLNRSSSSAHLEESLGERVREQIRISEQLDQEENLKRQKLLSMAKIDDEGLQRLIDKLQNEGIQVLTLSELLSLQLNGIDIDKSDWHEKLIEENSLLRSLIAGLNRNDNNNKLIECIGEIFRCERERRLTEIRFNNNDEKSRIERQIQTMCEYQRDALNKLLSQDRVALVSELQQSKTELNNLKNLFEQLKVQINSGKHLSEFYFKHLRSEQHRRALIYQKRYLLVLLTGYQDTERYALNQIRRLTGQINFKRKANVNYRFYFRSAVRVVVATIRMRWMAAKWSRKVSTIL